MASQELNILNVNGQDYEISDKEARDSLVTVKQKNIVTDVTLNSEYTDATKTLALSLNVTKGTIGG